MGDSEKMPERVGFNMRVVEDSRKNNCESHGEYESKGFSLTGRHMHWSMCPTCRSELLAKEEAAKKIAEVEEAQRCVELNLRQAGIPIRFRGKSFDSYEVGTDGKERARAVAMEFAANFKNHYEEGTTLVLSGRPGTGKSHLAMAIAQQIMPSYTAFYTSAIDAVRMVRDTWRKGSDRSEIDVLDELSRVDLLILDEVGVQYGSDSEQITLFDIIDKRYRNMMPIILLTNQNKVGMKEFLGDRSFDRLREGGIWVTFDWDSNRGAR